MTRVLAFTAGRRVASARFRVHQYTAPLAQLGIDVDIAANVFGSYPPRAKTVRPAWAAATLVTRIPGIIRSRYYDLTLLQRSFVSTFETLERFTGRPRVFDVDDALWLLPRGGFAGAIARRSDLVIAGNNFLADYFHQYCSEVVVLPTGVDTDRFRPRSEPSASESTIIGWSGGSSGHGALLRVAEPLRELCRLRPWVKLRVMSDRPPQLEGFSARQLDFVPWSEEDEVAVLQTFDIGVMPLADGLWERGKCSYKMLLYLACGTPVVVSPVGMNAEVLSLGDVGQAASTPGEWLDRLLELTDAPKTRSQMGIEARSLVERHFSVRLLAPQLASILRRSL